MSASCSSGDNGQPVRMDCALYAPAPPRRPGQKGRTQLKGKRLPTPNQYLAAADTKWSRALVNWYGGARRWVEVTTETAIWHRGGKPPVTIRWVWSGTKSAFVHRHCSAPLRIYPSARTCVQRRVTRPSPDSLGVAHIRRIGGHAEVISVAWRPPQPRCSPRNIFPRCLRATAKWPAEPKSLLPAASFSDARVVS